MNYRRLIITALLAAVMLALVAFTGCTTTGTVTKTNITVTDKSVIDGFPQSDLYYQVKDPCGIWHSLEMGESLDNYAAYVDFLEVGQTYTVMERSGRIIAIEGFCSYKSHYETTKELTVITESDLGFTQYVTGDDMARYVVYGPKPEPGLRYYVNIWMDMGNYYPRVRVISPCWDECRNPCPPEPTPTPACGCGT